MINIINEYVDAEGNAPYSDWLSSLKDKKTRDIIIARVERMAVGNFGNAKYLDDGVSELKINYGPGYRVYYAKEGNNIYLLLCGGNKSTQNQDIKLAKQYWINYQIEELSYARKKH